MKKIPMRKCVVTEKQYPKNELTRIVLTPEKKVELDLSGRKNGRGAYLLLTKENIELARKNRALERALRTTVSDEVYDALIDYVNQ